MERKLKVTENVHEFSITTEVPANARNVMMSCQVSMPVSPLPASPSIFARPMVKKMTSMSIATGMMNCSWILCSQS